MQLKRILQDGPVDGNGNSSNSSNNNNNNNNNNDGSNSPGESAPAAEWPVQVAGANVEPNLVAAAQTAARAALKIHNRENRVASHIKATMDACAPNGVAWNCVVGGSFGSHLACRQYVHLTCRQINVVVFR